MDVRRRLHVHWGAWVTACIIACADPGPEVEPRPAALALTTPPSATTQNRVAFPTQPVVQLRDAHGQPVAQAGIAITATISAGGGTLGGTTTATTGGSGAATFTDLSIAGTIGLRILTFSAPGLGPATADVTVTAGLPTSIGVNAGDNQRGIPGGPVATAPSVRITDADANAVSGVVVTFTVATGGGSTTGANPVTNGSGVGAVGSWTLGPTPGPNTLTAAAQGLSGSPVTFTATGVGNLALLDGGKGGSHTCGLTTDGAAFCWGDSFDAQLGNGTPDSTANNWLSPSPVAGDLWLDTIVVGGYHSCGLTVAGPAYCWGFNGDGRLGDGTTANGESPRRVATTLAFQKVAAGGVHTCGLTAEGAAYCWGRNVDGELGDGTTAARLTPVPVQDGHAFHSLTGGGRHTCGLAEGDVAYCWGRNEFGQLGDGSNTARSVPVLVTGGFTFRTVSAGNDHTCGLTADGVAYCWGANGHGQLGDGTTSDRPAPTSVASGLTFSTLVAGIRHTCARTPDGAAYCWGGNNVAQLGDGTTTGRLTPTPVVGGLKFQGLAAGGGHTCGVTTGGIAHCWGQNYEGQLGDGTSTNRSVPTAVRWP